MRRLTYDAILLAMFLAAGSCAVQGHCLIPESDLFLARDLRVTQDLNFTANLKDILDSYRYTENYSAGSFDCMDTCIIATKLLQEHGYSPGTMARFAPKGLDGDSHMWLSVSDGLGRFAFIETCAFASGRPVLGEVVAADESMNYSSGYVLVSPLKVMQCFGYSEERFLSHLGAVEKTASGPVILRREGRAEKRTRWIYQ